MNQVFTCKLEQKPSTTTQSRVIYNLTLFNVITNITAINSYERRGI